MKLRHDQAWYVWLLTIIINFIQLQRLELRSVAATVQCAVSKQATERTNCERRLRRCKRLPWPRFATSTVYVYYSMPRSYAAYRELSDWRSSSMTGDRSNCVHNSFRNIDTGCSVGHCAIGSVKLELCMYYEPDRRPSKFQLQHTRCNVCQTRYGLNAMLVNHLVMTNRRICLYKYPRDLFGNWQNWSTLSLINATWPTTKVKQAE